MCLHFNEQAVETDQRQVTSQARHDWRFTGPNPSEQTRNLIVYWSTGQFAIR